METLLIVIASLIGFMVLMLVVGIIIIVLNPPVDVMGGEFHEPSIKNSKKQL